MAGRPVVTPVEDRSILSRISFSDTGWTRSSRSHAESLGFDVLQIAGWPMAIKRIWHGWTTPDNAGTYENLLRTEVFPSIEDKKISGYHGIELLRRDHGSEIEFVTIMTFESLQSVIEFQGEDYERCYVPDTAQAVLERWDPVASHFEVREVRSYG